MFVICTVNDMIFTDLSGSMRTTEWGYVENYTMNSTLLVFPQSIQEKQKKIKQASRLYIKVKVSLVGDRD